MSSRVHILGGTGMLGSTVLSVLGAQGFAVTATTRDLAIVPENLRETFSVFNASLDDIASTVAGLGPGDVVVNCIGIIKHHLRDDVSADRLNAIDINAVLPYRLAAAAEAQGFRVIQIATDCVYSGSEGDYDESSAHDAIDVYGQTKSLGEVPSAAFLNLRCSIIGPEQKNRDSLLEWVLGHEPGSTFSGYLDHRWNGVTTDTFARVVAGLISSGRELTGTYHLVPADAVDKNTLSRLILDAYGRDDVAVTPVETGKPVDRTLATLHPEVNLSLWRDGGYENPPTIEAMLRTLAASSAVPSRERSK
jgi:dTDP-4-dehydrorhamnose reductase